MNVRVNQIVFLELRLAAIMTAHMMRHVADDALVAGFVGRGLPPHGAAEPVVTNVFDLVHRHLHSVVRDHGSGGRVVAICRARVLVEVLVRSRTGKVLVVPNSVLPASFTGPAVRLSGTIRILESAPVQRHSNHHLVTRNAVVDVIPDRLFSIERSAVWVVVALEQVCLMACFRIPRAGKIIRHQIDKVEVARHRTKVQLHVILRTGGRGNGQQEVRVAMTRVAELSGVSIQSFTSLLQEKNEVLSLGLVLRVFPVDIETIKAQVLEKLHSALREVLTTSRCGGRRSKVGAVSPATNGKENLEVPVALLEEVKLLDATIHIGANVIPRVAGVVFLNVGPTVRHIHFTGIRSYVGEGIEHVSQFVGRELLRIVLTTVDGPVDEVRHSPISVSATHCCCRRSGQEARQ